MPEWMLQLVGPMAGGTVTGLMLVAGLRVEVRNLKDSMGGVVASVHRAHARIDDHIERHHIAVRKGQ